ncbi:4-phosphoerythronate dehydrogenase [Thorsellia kenyensis]|uniref:Erythronate-4-phosphate dehydrogenase n=1 Tax=Thorsellia kenyensis TaxID=1549888 RepID=A0ABV6CCG3_9GAMM
MKIIVDDLMPKATTFFAKLGDVVSVPGRPFAKECLNEAQALMVRSVTPVNADLLSDSQVKFVGTATAGMDHIDIDSLKNNNVHVTSAAGCNAIAVVEYVFSCLFYFAQKNQFNLQDKTIGIVGVGHVGSVLAKRLQILGISVLLCDPPRKRQEIDAGKQRTEFVDFDTILDKADIITFHTPLIKGGVDNTYHLLDKEKLSKLYRPKIIINASRGEVIDNSALLVELKMGRALSVALDVFENEPHINVELLAYIDIATPHIAGHSLEGKLRGTTILVEKYVKFLNQIQPEYLEKQGITVLDEFESEKLLVQYLPEALITEVTLAECLDLFSLSKLARLLYDVVEDAHQFRYQMASARTATEIATKFDALRKNYSMRREWSSLNVIAPDKSSHEQLVKLGFKTPMK